MVEADAERIDRVEPYADRYVCERIFDPQTWGTGHGRHVGWG